MIIKVSLILAGRLYSFLYVFVILLLLAGFVFAEDNNTTVVAYDNATTDLFDNYTNNQDSEELYYDRYPVDIAKGLYITKDVNKQLKGSGLIFLPSSPGDVYPADDVNSNEEEQYEQNGDGMGIIEVKIKRGKK